MRHAGSFLQTSSLLLAAVSTTWAQSTDSVSWPIETFRSTEIAAPVLNVTKHGKTEPGYLFFSPMMGSHEKGNPAIYSDDGQLVWQGPMVNTSAYQPQMLDGEPVLAYWNGADIKGFGFGQITILNSSYQVIHEVTLQSTDEHPFVTVLDPQTYPSYIDIHESQFTDDGTILVTAVNVTQMDLSSLGGPSDAWVQDALFYEIDIKTNEVLFRWSTVEHVSQMPLSYSELPIDGKGGSKTEPYEYPHLNSVAKYGDSYLVSSRYMCTIFMVDKNGDVNWRLHGQKGGDFSLMTEASFCFQHDARIDEHTDDAIVLHMHNNENSDVTTPTTLTTGLTLRLDMKTKRVSVVGKVWDAADPVYAESQGSFQALDNDHILLQHGAVPKLEEYDENGALVMRARFGPDNDIQSYRGYRFPWVGRPKTQPAVAACPEKGKTAVYVSWNGATDVQSWKVLAGSESDQLRTVKTSVRNGFETRIAVEEAKMVMVQAVGGVGDGTKSQMVSVGDGC
ncbi:ASST-domain-containing protein [Aspergillus ambiguus]|uniref:arylsulfotransferase family protein n=1 Tax=Aspergillus ambiguus TaxID=176160 RepID=UPI003CCD979F